MVSTWCWVAFVAGVDARGIARHEPNQKEDGQRDREERGHNLGQAAGDVVSHGDSWLADPDGRSTWRRTPRRLSALEPGTRQLVFVSAEWHLKVPDVRLGGVERAAIDHENLWNVLHDDSLDLVQ